MSRWTDTDIVIVNGVARRSDKIKPRESSVADELATAFPLCRRIARIWRHNVGAVKMPSGQWVQFGEAGQADYIGFDIGGRFIAIEAKRPGENPTDEQMLFLTEVARVGGIAIVARRAEDVLAHFR